MMMNVILSISSAVGVNAKAACLFGYPIHVKTQELSFYDGQNKITGSQYRKSLTIRELGRNKFT
jgi:hypothetical protein